MPLQPDRPAQARRDERTQDRLNRQAEAARIKARAKIDDDRRVGFLSDTNEAFAYLNRTTVDLPEASAQFSSGDVSPEELERLLATFNAARSVPDLATTPNSSLLEDAAVVPLDNVSRPLPRSNAPKSFT
jgi:hypothetical protein